MSFFTDQEFACKCCGQVKMNPLFVDMFNKAQGYADVLFEVVSGYRCPKHEKEVGGKGNHNSGKAADIKCDSSMNRFKIVQGLLTAGFTRIGIAKTFIHADISTDVTHPQKVIWLY